MKRTTILTIALSAGSLMARAQFSIGINGGVIDPSRSVTDSLTILRSGYNINIDPSYSFGKFSLNSNLGYQSFNTNSGFQNMARQKNYTAEKGYVITSTSPGFYNAAVGAGFNVLPSGITGCGVNKPSLIISSQFGVLKPVNATNIKVSIDQKATVYSLTQSDKALPYFKAGADIVCPLNNLISIKSGVSYDRTTSDMQFQQSSNGNTLATNVAYSNIQFSVGIRFSFKGITEKGIKRSAAAKSGGNTSPLYNDGGWHAENPMGKEAGQGNGSTPAPAANEVNNPLYSGNTSSGDNPLYKGDALVAGQPIGGIVVKGGQNPGGSALVAGSPIGGIVVKGGKNPGGSALVAGSPIGGIVVKGGQNPGGSALVAGSPIGGIVVKGGKNGDVDPGSALVEGNPIGGIIVKGGKNPGGSFIVLNNGKSISEKGIKRSDFAIKENGIKVAEASSPNAFAIKENGIKVTEASSPNSFAIKENGIKSLNTPNQKGIQEKGMKTQAMIYTSDFSVEDPMLLSYLGTSELIIKKGEYAFDYSKNPNGELKLQLSKNIIHRDLAARNLTFVGFNPETKAHFEYTIEPEYVNGVADHIIVSYKSISEKGIK